LGSAPHDRKKKLRLERGILWVLPFLLVTSLSGSLDEAKHGANPHAEIPAMRRMPVPLARAFRIAATFLASVSSSRRRPRCVPWSRARAIPASTRSRIIRDSLTRPDSDHVNSIETGGPFPLRFLRLLRFVQLKGGDKLLQLILGRPHNFPCGKSGRLRWKAEYSSISFLIV
jgi:hypothetical protein